MRSEEKIALVTGASSGFGLLTVLSLARRGFRVVATMRDVGKQATLMSEAERFGVAALVDIARIDVTDEASIDEAVAGTVAKYGRIDALVNNAGFAVGGFIEEVPPEAWREQMETNFMGVVSMTRAVLPHMRRQGEGTVIQIGSVSGRVGMPGFGAYAASKFAIEGFSESLRHEVASYGIRVYVVEPGAYRTPIWNKGFDGIHTRPDSPYRSKLQAVLEFARKTAESSPDPREVAELAARLAAKKRPGRLRYPVGRGARSLIAASKLLPWRWIEVAVRRSLDK